jgi:predicted O-methyltransferase YrrM
MSEARIQFAEAAPAGQSFRPRSPRFTDHPLFAWAGLRPPIAQHTAAEHDALERYARGRKNLVEIGVAEGASAIALRRAMDSQGTLNLIDPFHLSRVRALNFLRRAARRAVADNSSKRIIWIESFSQDAVRDWHTSIDFLLIDGDHGESAVERDWKDWHPHVEQQGVVLFHDARLFSGGWTSCDYGPVRFVDRAFRNNPASSWKIVEEVDSLVVLARKDHVSS